jgi:hypothetical protein
MPETPVPFDQSAAERILNATSEPVADIAFGQGDRLTTAGGQALEVFPNAVRVTGPDFRVEVVGEPLTPDLGLDWIGFRGTTADGMTRFVALRDSGEVLFKKTAPPATYQAAEDQASTLPSPADESAAQTDSEPGQERGELVAFTGRIGRDPRIFRSPPGNITREPGDPQDHSPRVKMAVAEHVEAEGRERTVWHEVWTSEKLGPKVAEQVDAGVLIQGVEVAVKGYRHEHPPTRPGSKTKPFVRAFMINPVKSHRPKQG